jgi:hypothetical protein
MVRNLMLELGRKTVIGAQLIVEDRRTGFHIVANLLLKSGLAAPEDVHRTNSAAALDNTEDAFLVTKSMLWPFFSKRFALSMVRRYRDRSFIDLDLTRELAAGEFILHRETDSVKHKPGCFLRNSKIAGHLVAANSVLAIGKHPDSGKPLVQWNGRILKDASGFDGELFPAFGALPDTPSLQEHRFSGPTMLTDHAARPTAIRDLGESVIRAGVMPYRLQQGLGFKAFHSSSMEPNCGCGKYIYARLPRRESS